jgi:putative ABC transport system permease protein
MIARWTVKELLRARMRVLGSIVSVGAAFALVIMFRAVWEGETRQLAVYLEEAGADVWVMQRHVSNMHMASSFISEGKRVELGRVEGVGSVDGILYLNTMVEAGGRQWFSYVVGIDEADQLGGPWSLAEGRGEVSSGEAVIPETLSRLTATSIGDSIQVADLRFEVVGLSRETFSVTNPVTFVPAADLSDLLSLSGYESYMLVRADPGVPPAELAARIEAEVDGVAALTTADFVANDLQLHPRVSQPPRARDPQGRGLLEPAHVRLRADSSRRDHGACVRLRGGGRRARRARRAAARPHPFAHPRGRDARPDRPRGAGCRPDGEPHARRSGRAPRSHVRLQ